MGHLLLSQLRARQGCTQGDFAGHSHCAAVVSRGVWLPSQGHHPRKRTALNFISWKISWKWSSSELSGCIYMHQALPPPPSPPPYGMGPIYWSHMRSSPSPPCGVVGVWHCPPPPPVVWWGCGMVWWVCMVCMVGLVWHVWKVWYVWYVW